MSQAMIGGSESLRQGPWPACLGMEGSACQHVIETYAEDLRGGHVSIIGPDTMVTMDFDITRVRIFVDEANLVIQIPNRG